MKVVGKDKLAKSVGRWQRFIHRTIDDHSHFIHRLGDGGYVRKATQF